MPITIVGSNQRRIDGVEKVTGAATYTVDIRLPGMLVAKLKRSPHAHARILNVDARRALRVPGVRAVASHLNCESRYYSGGGGIVVTVRDMKVFDSVARYLGDGVAAVAAESEEAALEALELIDVDYEILPAVFDPEEAMRPEAPQIHADLGFIRNNIARYVSKAEGDIEAGFKDAYVVTANRFRTSRVQHATLEPHAAVAFWDIHGRLKVWSSTQSPFGIRSELAETLGIPEGRISVQHSGHVGGSFGGKMDSYQRETVCAVLARMTGSPVRLEYTRAEEFACAVTRHPMVIDIKLGADRSGQLVAADFRVVADTGAYASDGPSVLGLAGFQHLALYKVPNYRAEAYCVYTNNPVAGACRGYGNPQGAFAWEVAVDELAESLGIDPVELRLRNGVNKGDPNRLNPGKVFNSCGLADCLKKGADHSGWARRQPPAEKSGRIRRGIGVAAMIHNTGTGGTGRKPEHSAAYLKLNADGSVMVITGVSDTGQGNVTGIAQIAAEELGLPFEKVVTSGHVDTDICPMDLGSFASRCTYVAGNAVRQAAIELKRQVIRAAARLLKVPEEALEYRGGIVFSTREPEKQMTVAQIVHDAELDVSGATNFIATASYTGEVNAPAFGAQFIEVAVDTDTGKVDVERVTVAQDSGKVINPGLLKSQLEGAIQMGLGYALTEELKVDAAGRVENGNYADYKMFTALDMPPVDIILVEDSESTGPFGAKGVGEPGLVPTAPAVANAIYNAIGVRIRELPITPQAILKALRETKDGRRSGGTAR